MRVTSMEYASVIASISLFAIEIDLVSEASGRHAGATGLKIHWDYSGAEGPDNKKLLVS